MVRWATKSLAADSACYGADANYERRIPLPVVRVFRRRATWPVELGLTGEEKKPSLGGQRGRRKSLPHFSDTRLLVAHQDYSV